MYKIIEKINPEIIFEEIPISYFDAYYKNRNILETNAINKHLESHQLVHIPVDYFNVPISFFKDNEYMHKQVECISFEYHNIIDTHSLYTRESGFKYLNSIYCNNLFYELYNAIEKSL